MSKENTARSKQSTEVPDELSEFLGKRVAVLSCSAPNYYKSIYLLAG